MNEPWAAGGAFALLFLILACAAGTAARRLRAPSDLREPRHTYDRARVVGRKTFLGRLLLIALGAGGALATGALAAFGPRPAQRVIWRRGTRLLTSSGAPIRAHDLDVGGIATVFPDGGRDVPDAATVLIRLDDGTVAFSKVCTHAGCPVAIYRKATHELYCPCHQSTFSVERDGIPTGGPATRRLPRLPLATDGDGYLVASGDFDGPVGPIGET